MISRLPLTISNAYLIQCEQPILVDTGLPGDFQLLLRRLEKEGLTLHELAMIVHTHAHADHVGSTHAIKEKADIPTIIHTNDLQWIEKGANAPAGAKGLTGLIGSWFLARRFKPFSTEIIFEGEMDLNPFGAPAKLIHTPGHTLGSASIVFENGEAIIGDLLSGGHFGGYIQPSKPRFPYLYRDKKNILMNVQRLLDWGIQRFHVGHGGPLKRDDVAKWLQQRK